MSQFGGVKNPPWVRDVAGLTAPGAVAVGSLQQALQTPVLSQPGVVTNTIYCLPTAQAGIATPQQYSSPYANQQQQLGVAMQQAALQQSLPQPGIAIPTSLAATQVAVSYPTPRVAQQAAAAAAANQPKQRVFTGTITKLHDNFGFVDEDVFFQMSCVKGHLPKVMDRVLVEATYNATMPFKWNATRIQVLPSQMSAPHSQSGQFGQQGLSSLPGSYVLKSQQQILSQSMGSGNLGSGLGGGVQPPPLMSQHPQSTTNLLSNVGRGIVTAKRPDIGYRGDRSRDRDRHSGHDRRDSRRSPIKRSWSPRRSRSPVARTKSPSRRSRRVVPRYVVQIPKLTLDTPDASVITLKSRYSNLYVPSDFFDGCFNWVDVFPLHRPLTLGHQCSFHIRNKDAEPLENEKDATVEPTDVDHLYSAKVMLMSTPSLDELYHKSCGLAEDNVSSSSCDSRSGDLQHPTRLIQFLVGLKGKSEPMAIGGAWSPSADGPNPGNNPHVLIKTAIRTTKALTGIDLSQCTHWYRFAEMHYRRPEETHKGRIVPARVETVVIFLPDVWSCSPTRLEWQTMSAAYKKQLQDKLSCADRADHTQQGDEEESEGNTSMEEKKDPTHYSELDPKTMKVADLRRELECRSLSPKGLKSQLIARLCKAVKTEQEEDDEENDDSKDEEMKEELAKEKEEQDEEEKKKEEEEKKKQDERDRAAVERKYTLPENPTIVVQPSATAKGGKFDCTVMSLSLLLDYRPEDNKEHSFEVSLFAELFNEMLMRDFAFTMYKALVAAPEPPAVDKKDHGKARDSKESKDSDDKKEDKEEPQSKKQKSDDKRDQKDDKKKSDKRDDKKNRDEKAKIRDDRDVDQDDDASDQGNDSDKDKDKKKQDKKKEKVKLFTANPALLMAFVYFDQSRTNYLMDKDVEEIIHTVGLRLSRSQVKKLVQKMVTRDTLSYRKMTDRPQVKDVTAEVEMKDVTAPQEEKADLDDKTLAQGNKPLLSSSHSDAALSKSVSSMKDGEAVSSDAPTMMMYHGAMVDVDSVMMQLERSEKSRTMVESRLRTVQTDMDNLQSSFNTSEQSSQKMAQELSELKRKLQEQQKSSEALQANSKSYYDMLARSKSTLGSLTAAMATTLEEKPLKNIKQEMNGEK